MENISLGSDAPVGRFEFVVQLTLIICLCVGAAWLWPDDLLGSPMTAITFPDVLRVVSTPGLLAAAAVWLYLLITPPLKSTEPGPIEEPREQTPAHLGTPGYRGQ